MVPGLHPAGGVNRHVGFLIPGELDEHPRDGRSWTTTQDPQNLNIVNLETLRVCTPTEHPPFTSLQFDVGRSDNGHITFGAGIHFCIGAPLARVELQASFGALLDRTTTFELGGEPVRRPEFVIRGLETLPVVLA